MERVIHERCDKLIFLCFLYFYFVLYSINFNFKFSLDTFKVFRVCQHERPRLVIFLDHCRFISCRHMCVVSGTLFLPPVCVEEWLLVVL